MAASFAPGVHLDVVQRKPAPRFDTGVPAFLGLVPKELRSEGSRVQGVDAALFSALAARIPASSAESFLGAALRGFFENGGRRCYLVAQDAPGIVGLDPGLEELEAYNDFDLICAPDLVRVDNPKDLALAQRRILDFAVAKRGVFAILDSLSGRGLDPRRALDLVKTHRSELNGAPGASRAALYAPWLMARPSELVPPSGHVAGVFARTDHEQGVHKAPANTPIAGVIDVSLRITPADADDLPGLGINAIRAFPGRGIRVWGARTVEGEAGLAWVNGRRLVLTIGRWLEQALAGLAFEPHNPSLWFRIQRDVDAFLGALFDKGALAGTTREEAYLVKCDAETNPPAIRDAGQVVTEIRLSPQAPGEVVHLRVILGRESVATASQ